MNIVITGASSGIGEALAVAVHAKGHRPVLVARRKAELERVSQRCGGAPVIVADVGDEAQVQRAMAEALAAVKRVDVWVNNAGRGISRMPTQLSGQDLDEMMTANVKSALYGMQAVLPHFKERGDGQIINVSSMLGRVPFATIRSAYCGAKHFLNALTACVRAEVQATHPKIHVSLFSPGVVTTDFGKNALHGGPDSRTLPNSQSAEDVAAALLQLIEAPRPDAYSREGMKQTVVDYYANL
ncbi:MAG: SDR family NAD(P)-dependent oxidoreductase [Myxococcaceae bacterium]